MGFSSETARVYEVLVGDAKGLTVPILWSPSIESDVGDVVPDVSEKAVFWKSRMLYLSRSVTWAFSISLCTSW